MPDYFDLAIAEMKRVHDKKKADYSDPSDAFSNFRLAGDFADVSTPLTFEVLLGVKQARLNNLRESENSPLNESILDTLLDRANYATLAYAYALAQQEKK